MTIRRSDTSPELFFVLRTSTEYETRTSMSVWLAASIVVRFPIGSTGAYPYELGEPTASRSRLSTLDATLRYSYSVLVLGHHLLLQGQQLNKDFTI
eukprot:scaffold15627_cov21-Prasinocladus_malaysianus.AAC.1